jgi:hypothetical protein
VITDQGDGRRRGLVVPRALPDARGLIAAEEQSFDQRTNALSVRSITQSGRQVVAAPGGATQSGARPTQIDRLTGTGADQQKTGRQTLRSQHRYPDHLTGLARDLLTGENLVQVHPIGPGQRPGCGRDDRAPADRDGHDIDTVERSVLDRREQRATASRDSGLRRGARHDGNHQVTSGVLVRVGGELTSGRNR